MLVGGSGFPIYCGQPGASCADTTHMPGEDTVEQAKSHQTTLTIINAFSAMCLGVLFAYCSQKGLLSYGVKPGAWQNPFVVVVYLVAFYLSWKLIQKTSVGVVDAPVAEDVSPAEAVKESSAP